MIATTEEHSSKSRLELKHASNKYPEWLDLLLQSKFFTPCLNLNHEELRKGEINVFCIDCKVCLCQHCLATPLHLGHKQLQIRRYMYRDVVKIDDMQKLMSCSRVMVLYERENNGCDTFELSQMIEMEMEVEVEKENKNAELFSPTDSVHSNENNNSFNNLDGYNLPFELNLKHKRKGVPRRSPFF
ncbi:hypothetical protein CKAN_00345600 [Cinnamomum micranthum f. kanehirae]|uniref:B box-type domain-containing protein n=1 Tax=Cinnamomum micranthum f. kanehirae TaxID=337451 RepID=A0A3S3MES8_9MAGN|nr:hypothetical protein CKAN_00345600 [Cinnamomum micranthum f. kanehirae]